MKKEFVLLGMLLLFFFAAKGQEQEYHKHVVKKGERVRQIAKDYGLKSKDVYRLNPGVRKRPKANAILLIPIKDIKKPFLFDGVQVHPVQAKETLYGICKKYNVAIAALMDMNPSLKETGLETGVLLKIPNTKVVSKEVLLQQQMDLWTKQYELHTVVKDDTFYRLTHFYKVSKAQLLALNPTLDKGLKLGAVLKIRKRKESVSPVGTVDSTSMNFTDSMFVKQPMNVVFLMPFKFFKNDTLSKEALFSTKNNLVNIITDFYLGAELAIDSLATRGLEIDFRVFDTEKNKDCVEDFLDRNEFEGVDVVFGPVFSQFADRVASQLPEIPVVFPLHSSRQHTFQSPNLVKTATDVAHYQELILQHIKATHSGQHIVVVGDEKPNSLLKMAAIGAQLKQSDSIQEVDYLQPENGYIDRERFVTAVDTLGVNWVLLTSNNKVVTADVVNNLKSLPNNPKVKLFAFEKAKNFDKVDNNQLAKMNFTYASSEVFGDSLPEVLNFYERYAAKNHAYPSKHALRGFDVVYDVLLRMALQEPDNTEGFVFKGSSKRLNSSFSFDKRTPEAPTYNKAAFLLKYNEDLSIQVLNDLESTSTVQEQKDSIF